MPTKKHVIGTRGVSVDGRWYSSPLMDQRVGRLVTSEEIVEGDPELLFTHPDAATEVLEPVTYKAFDVVRNPHNPSSMGRVERALLKRLRAVQQANNKHR